MPSEATTVEPQLIPVPPSRTRHIRIREWELPERADAELVAATMATARTRHRQESSARTGIYLTHRDGQLVVAYEVNDTRPTRAVDS